MPPWNGLEVLLPGHAQWLWHGVWWEDDLENVRAEQHSALQIAYMGGKKSQLKHTGYIIPDGNAEKLLATAAMGDAASMPSDFLRVTPDKLFEFVQSKAIWEEKLKAEEERSFWNPIYTTL